MGKKVHIYNVVDSRSKQPKTTDTIWWTGRTIESDNKMLLRHLTGMKINGKTVSDGIDFFYELPFVFHNGYISLKQIK